MAFSKAHLDPDNLRLPGYYAKALNYPERLRIIQLLAENGPMPVFEIVERSPLHETVASQHLTTLRKTVLLNVIEKPPYTQYMH